MWFRVFSTSALEPAPARLLEHLQAQGYAVRGDFRADEQGWFRAALTVDAEDEPLELQRYLASEDGIRAELNTWAAWLETVAPDRPELPERVVTAGQVFTLQFLGDSGAEEAEVGAELCRFLARQPR